MRNHRIIAATVAACGCFFSWPLWSQQTRIEEVKFSNGDISLAGRLYLPAKQGRCPAILFTHGSGDSGRNNPRYKEEADSFASAGIASLTFDKRGSGDSTGDWRTATFEDLATDALAAVGFLKTRRDIDARNIGLRGASQSGWVLPIAAARSPDVAFLILISPPGVTPYEQILYDVRTDLEDGGFSPPEVESGVALTRSGLDYARAWTGWPGHKKRLTAASQQRWFSAASGPPDPDDWLWKWVHPLIDFDSLPVVESLHIPILVLLGEQDRETPSQVAGYRFERALRSGHPRSLVRYFPSGNHDLRSATADKTKGRPPFADGFLQTMKEWVLQVSKP